MARNEQNADFSYKYYTLGLNNPVRVKLNAQKQAVGAEVPDADTQKFRIQTTLLSRLATSPDAEEIDKATFDGMCQAIFQKKTFKGGGEMKLSL